MVVYYFILCGLTFLGVANALSNKNKNYQNVIVIIALLLLFIFAALRSINIGADTRQYVSHFLKISNTNISDFSNYNNGWYGDVEIGYKFYNKFISFFSKNPQAITIVNSLVQILLISILIFRDSKHKWLSVFLYYTFCFYQTALNLTPSSFVSYFVFLSFPFIKNKKLIAFLAFVLIGMTFHTSAIFFIPLYFLSKIKISPKSMFAVLCICLFCMIGYSTFLSIIINIIPAKYVWYIDSAREHAHTSVELLVYISHFIALVFCLLMLNKQKRKKFIEDNPVMLWAFIFETVLYVLSTQSSMFSRGAFLFSPFVIIMIPEILNTIDNKNKRFIATCCIVIYGLVLYIARVNVNNVGTTMPYEFFF